MAIHNQRNSSRLTDQDLSAPPARNLRLRPDYPEAVDGLRLMPKASESNSARL